MIKRQAISARINIGTAASTPSLQNAFTSCAWHTFISSSRWPCGKRKSGNLQVSLEIFGKRGLKEKTYRIDSILCNWNVFLQRLDCCTYSRKWQKWIRQSPWSIVSQSRLVLICKWFPWTVKDIFVNFKRVWRTFELCCCTHHRTRYSSTDTWSPRSIHFMSCRSRGQTPNKQYHETKSCHRGANYYKNDLNRINPGQTQSEDSIKHNDGQRSTTIHRPTKYAHPNETHHCGD